MNIFLIGMTGSGKSTLGKSLASLLHCDYEDLDESIIHDQKITINEIFERNGEAFFRKIESDCLLKSLKHEGFKVIATGGGAPCFFDNMHFMNVHGLTVWLNPDAETIVKRLTNAENRDNRPMVRNKSDSEVYEFVNNKLLERIPFYSQAKIILSDNQLSVNALHEAILQYL